MFLNPTQPKNNPKTTPKSGKNLSQNIVSIENESYSAIQIDPKNIFEHYPSPEISSLGPQKAKKDPKIRSIIKSKNWKEHRK